MSAEALAIVLHHSKSVGTPKVVLIGIANHDGDGGAWPAISTLAKYANVDERNVRKAIDKLVMLREVRVIERKIERPGRNPTNASNLYEIRLQCPAWCDRSRHHKDTRRNVRHVPTPLFGDAEMLLLDHLHEPLQQGGDASDPPDADVTRGADADVTRGADADVTLKSPFNNSTEAPIELRDSSPSRARDVDALTGDDYSQPGGFINTRCVAGHRLIDGTNYCEFACREQTTYLDELAKRDIA
jgi:hypothetical protein